MLIGYARVSKNDGSQILDSQLDILKKAGVEKNNIYFDKASGMKEDRAQLIICLKVLRKGDILMVSKLDRLGRSLHHLIGIVNDLNARGVGFRVISGIGQEIDTTTAGGRLIFSIFGALAEFERELMSERTKAGLSSARARGRKGGRKHKITRQKVIYIQAQLKHPGTIVADVARELDVTTATIYNYVTPNGELTDRGNEMLLANKKS